MKIVKEGSDLVLRLPLWQKSYDAVGELIGDVPNLIGVVAGHEFSLSQLIDLGYKDDQQEGGPYIMFDDEKSLREKCKEFGIEVWEYQTCAVCGKALRGTYTYGYNGAECLDHSRDESLDKKNTEE